MLEIIQLEHNFNKKDMIMIGDNYDTDILAGLSFGIDTMHVNTGVSTTEDVKVKTIQPTYCIENLNDWI
jgi:4-nitrophenyl phosphatase